MFFWNFNDYLFTMTFYKFEEINTNHTFLGGKAYALGLMANAHFPVPNGAVLSQLPSENQEWEFIFEWWKNLGSPKLAIRSSAQGEDSGDQSFAGQNSTFLNICDTGNIKKSVEKCFESINKKSSALYREHFLKEKSKSVQMNVVLQIMVDPLYSGVFFSIDPRTNEKNWVLEAIEGYGEDLVSGKKTPFHFVQNKNPQTKLFNLEEVVEIGNKVRDYFGFEIDMEWAIDKNNKFYVLQARPITALSGKTSKKKLINEEIDRLIRTHDANTIWDGQTFSEWSGPPSELTFSIWREAFSANRAFSSALKKLGYLGVNEEIKNETHTLLEKIFGRAYVNISLMAPLYFGSIPYKMIPKPHPHLKFDYHRMTFSNFMHTPLTMWKMLQVGWRLSTERRTYLDECIKELNFFKIKLATENYQQLDTQELIKLFVQDVETFSSQVLVYPLVLIILIESTSQSLRAMLDGVIPPSEIEQKLKEWMSNDLHTVTMKMNEDYQIACLDESKRASFLKIYGHRGPGELELSHLRWSELADKIFYKNIPGILNKSSKNDVLLDIRALKTYKKIAIEKEWLLLKEMLELREAWKMNLLKPYAEIRTLALEIATRERLADSIFWHDYKEIAAHQFNAEKALERKEKANLLKSISLPPILCLKELRAITEEKISSKSQDKSQFLTGTPLSPGFVFGEVRVVIDPETIDTNLWPENVILVAESTDPGWTGLFLKSKAVIVEKGGVLSHCAIVAREMNLPAISEIKQCHLRFKDGDKIWVDGNNGRITYS
ncbi:MAG: PEP/pyruvate-binding domain-containing protein [Bacteriovorax sp.]|nr:PEP/pyruvate-binding domain-containing protein [Bacteriovorax sp.]